MPTYIGSVLGDPPLMGEFEKPAFGRIQTPVLWKYLSNLEEIEPEAQMDLNPGHIDV